MVGRDDGNRRDLRDRWGNLFVHGRRGLLLADNGGFILNRFLLGFGGNLDATHLSWLRSGGRDFLFLLHRNGSRGRSRSRSRNSNRSRNRSRRDLGFFGSRWFVTGRGILRFRRRIIYIVHVSSPVDFGGSLVDGGPPAVDDEFVQDLFPPANADGSGKAGRTLIHTNGTSPLLEKCEDLARETGPEAKF